MTVLISHKRAHFDFTPIEEFEAGVELLGTEVKSLRTHRGKLEGAHIVVRGGEAYLIGADIPAYQSANVAKEFSATRNRRLLLNKKEIAALAHAEEEKGLAIIPIALLAKGRRIKLKLAIARGKKKVDKRETIKRREADRDIARAMKVR